MADDAKQPPRESDIQEAVEELLVDPDSPDKGNADRPPQTIDNEPSGKPAD